MGTAVVGAAATSAASTSAAAGAASSASTIAATAAVGGFAAPLTLGAVVVGGLGTVGAYWYWRNCAAAPCQVNICEDEKASAHGGDTDPSAQFPSGVRVVDSECGNREGTVVSIERGMVGVDFGDGLGKTLINQEVLRVVERTPRFEEVAAMLPSEPQAVMASNPALKAKMLEGFKQAPSMTENMSKFHSAMVSAKTVVPSATCRNAATSRGNTARIVDSARKLLKRRL